MLQHVVLFKFPEPLGVADATEMRRLVGMFTDIDVVQGARFGSPMMPDWADGYQYLLYVELENAEALAEYLQHPAHTGFGDWVQARRAQTPVITFSLDDLTIVQASRGGTGGDVRER